MKNLVGKDDRSVLVTNDKASNVYLKFIATDVDASNQDESAGRRVY